jgi:ribosomal protein S12 methylthiotransferase accessory factor
VIAALPPQLRRAVSSYTGIVGSVEECLHGTADPPLFQAACGHDYSAGGTGRTRVEAASAAIGEALERYSATYVPRERLVVATARELGDDVVAPERFGLFSDDQLGRPGFPFRPFIAETRVAWVEGRAVRTGETAFLPAELVYLGPATLDGAKPIGHCTSSGLACDGSLVGALVTGACELLERDAFMIVWANRLSRPLLEPGDTVVGEQVAFARTGLRFAAVDLSPFHRMPTVLGVVRAPEGVAGALGVGAATAPTIERAWWKALAEAFAARAAGVKLALLGPDRSADGVASFEDHIRHYADHENASRTAFLDASPERRPLDEVPPLEGGSPETWLEALCGRAEAAGSTLYAVDVTSPDVAELGLTVVRVVAPGLCFLDASHAARFLGGRRLYEAAAALGLRRGPLPESDVNPDPHPFP